MTDTTKLCVRCQDTVALSGDYCEDCNGHNMERRKWMERDSTIPKALQAIPFASLDQAGNEAAFAAAEHWAQGELGGLVLTGPVGVGKTTLAAAAAWARRFPAQWASIPAVIAKSFGDDEARRQAAVALTDGRSIVLDDIDKVKAGDWVAAQLFTAIDSRISEGAPLLVTMNLNVGELAQAIGGRFGEAIASRLAGYCEIHEMVGQDRRLSA